MKIQRVHARDMREAMRKVREAHGPDAVLLSSRRTGDGVEVISAVDFDQESIEAALEETRLRARREAVTRADGGNAGAPLTESRIPHVDLRLDDDVDLPGAGPAASAPAAAGARAGREADRAVDEMRGELKMLRSLFENQVTLMQWKRVAEAHPVETMVLGRLTAMGFGPDVCRKVAAHAGALHDPERALRRALGVIAHNLPVSGDDVLDRGGVVAVVGPTGVGKTTTVAKLAARQVLRHGRDQVALLTTDNFRIGAQEQLRNFARILDVPMQAAGTPEELAASLEELADRRLVLIDTAGMSQRDMRLAEQFRTLTGPQGSETRERIRTYLALSCNTQLSTLAEVVRAFQAAAPAGCILTKADEATSLGAALTVVVRRRLPVAYVGVGQRVPEDIQPARASRLVEMAVGLARRYAEQPDDESLALTFGGVAADAR